MEQKTQKSEQPAEPTRLVQIRLSDNEVAAIRRITKVDWVATAVVAIVRKAIEDEKK